MQKIETSLPGVYVFEPKVYPDDRGFFMEFYNEDVFASLGITTRFVQDNHSHSVKGVLRGLHYQLNRPQAKLVKVLDGEVFDVAVDIRRNSPSFGEWTGVVLNSENRKMLYVPEGFAHGFLVLSETVDFIYKCSDFYVPEQERGILWNDEKLNIDWPTLDTAFILSDKDKASKTFCNADLPNY